MLFKFARVSREAFLEIIRIIREIQKFLFDSRDPSQGLPLLE